MTDLIVLQEDDHLHSPRVLVGLAQATLYPSQRLQQDHGDTGDCNQLLSSDCMMLSLVGMCLDNDEEEEEDPLIPNVKTQKAKPYVPPPVTWSQPAIIVPPSDEAQEERLILLHGRVARALGIENRTLVWFRFDGEKERRKLVASVDDQATFHVVIEADWNQVPNLRPVSLNVMETQQRDGEYHSNATFALTPNDGLTEGVLYFDGVCCLDGVNDQRGVMSAGLGFCIYSCRQEPRIGTRGAEQLCKETKLVSSYRFLGRPFCPNHAEYAALIEGLEWLFRFNFSKVWIVGPPDVISLLRGDNIDEGEVDDITLEIPQIQKANSIARHMINSAIANGLEIRYHGDDYYVGDEEEENWEATELADKAIDLARNATTVYWTNIREANQNLKNIPACMSVQQDQEKYSNETEEWSLLEGEQVMNIQDEDFDPPKRDTTSSGFNTADNSIVSEEDNEEENRASMYFSDSGSSTEDDDDDEPIEHVAGSLMDKCMHEFDGTEEDEHMRQLLDCASNSSTELTGHLASSRSVLEQEEKRESDRKITRVQTNRIHETKNHRAGTTTKQSINLRHMKTRKDYGDDQSALQSIWMSENSETPIGTKQRGRQRRQQVDDIFESKINYEEDEEERDPSESIPFARFCLVDAMELMKGIQDLIEDVANTLFGDNSNPGAKVKTSTARASCSRKGRLRTSKQRMQNDQYLPPRPPRKTLVV